MGQGHLGVGVREQREHVVVAVDFRDGGSADTEPRHLPELGLGVSVR